MTDKQAKNTSQIPVASNDVSQDPIWDIAWAWVQLQYSREATFDAEAQQKLVEWLAIDVAHRKSYDKACRLWLIAGLVPPANEIPIPGCNDLTKD